MSHIVLDEIIVTSSMISIWRPNLRSGLSPRNRLYVSTRRYRKVLSAEHRNTFKVEVFTGDIENELFFIPLGKHAKDNIQTKDYPEKLLILITYTENTYVNIAILLEQSHYVVYTYPA